MKRQESTLSRGELCFSLFRKSAPALVAMILVVWLMPSGSLGQYSITQCSGDGQPQVTNIPQANGYEILGYPLGGGSSECIANTFSGLSQVISFTTSLEFSNGGSYDPYYYAAVFNSTTLVQSVNITDQVHSIGGGSGPIVANFSDNPVTLDSQTYYWVALCQSTFSSGTNQYGYSAASGGYTYTCYINCAVNGGDYFSTVAYYPIAMTLTYVCPATPSPSPSPASPSPTPSATSSPSPSPSPSATPSPSSSPSASISVSPSASTSLTPSATPSSSPSASISVSPSSSRSPSGTPSPSSTSTPSPSASTSFTPSATTSPSPTPSSSGTPSVTPSQTTSPSASPSFVPTLSPTSSQTPSASPSPSSSASASPSSSIPPSPSASTSSIPVASPITQNVTNNFDPTSPTVSITVPSSSGSNVSGVQVGFSATGSGNNNVTISDNYQITNSTSVGKGVLTQAWTYSTSFVDTSSNATGFIDQSFSSSSSSTVGSFAGSSFTVPQGAIKWSVNIFNCSGSFPNGLTLNYNVPLLGPTTSGVGTVILSGNLANITTYDLEPPSYVDGQPAVQLALFDVAEVDGSGYQQISHSVSASVDKQGNTLFILTIQFPPFSSSIVYDPVVNLATLKAQSSGGGGSSSDNTGLIVGLTVGLGVPALLLVAALVVVVVVIVVIKFKGRGARSTTMYSEDDSL